MTLFILHIIFMSNFVINRAFDVQIISRHHYQKKETKIVPVSKCDVHTQRVYARFIKATISITHNNTYSNHVLYRRYRERLFSQVAPTHLACLDSRGFQNVFVILTLVMNAVNRWF